MNILKLLTTIFFISLITGCYEKISPAYTFKTSDDIKNSAQIELKKHSRSQINIEKGKVIRLNLDTSYISSDDEYDGHKENDKIDGVGNRELLVYAKIYKNGKFIQYKNLVNIAEHMWLYSPMAVNNTNIFTETIDSYYRIELKVYEVDTSSLVKILRMVQNTDIESIESTYNPGSSTMTGIKKILMGIFDVVSGVTAGRTVDDFAAIIEAEPLFEHSIYITPSNSSNNITGLLLVGGNGLIKEKKELTKLDANDNNAENINDNNYKTYKKIDEKFLNDITKDRVKIEELREGTFDKIIHFPYIFITIDNLNE